MKEFIPAICLGLGLSLFSCTNTPDVEDLVPTFDSCAVAQKFYAAVALGYKPSDFSGDVTNYWGEDTTKVDMIHHYESGQLLSSTFYYENGKMQRRHFFKCESLHGPQEFYHEDGYMTQVIPYRFGYRNGTGKLFDVNGNVVETVTFLNDSIVSDDSTD